MARNQEATLIIAASERDANLYYATRFLAPDPFIFSEIDAKKILIISELEVDRARQEARVDEVISTTGLIRKLKRRGLEQVTTADMIHSFFHERGVRNVLVPGSFPIEHADGLRKRGYHLRSKPDPFYERRMIKQTAEIKAIEEVLRHTERAIRLAFEVLGKAKIKGRFLIYKGKRLTAEAIKQVINVDLAESGCVAAHTIVSCGTQCVDPHNQGSGPLLAHESIILDVFPHSSKTRYFADTTRTVVRGKASKKLKRMYRAVLEGQHIAFRTIRDGRPGNKIHEAIVTHLETLGFKSGEIGGRMQGFFHGTGHGVGLDIHEPPRISASHDVLRAGEVVTVEPGLYYLDSGGVRLEDMVVVTKTGCRNLSRLPKVLEI